MHTPVALIIFNRPDTTAQVFAEIAKAKPQKLLVIADGPRPDRPGEAAKCAAARAIVDRVDWECELLKNYSDVNLGCGRRPATGISWVFEQVEEAIILEDDCIPHPSFFRFCEELLEKYRDDERVMHIAGNNFLFGRKAIPFSYVFSSHNLSWGWASWRRAWQHHHMEVKLWPMLRDGCWLLDTLGDLLAAQFYAKVFDKAYGSAGSIDYWDYQWSFACWAQNGLSILPGTTLVSNVGFGKDATHTIGTGDRRAYLPTTEVLFPLKHPPYVLPDKEVDRIILEEVILAALPQEPNFYDRLRAKCIWALPRPVRKSLSSLRSRLKSHL